MKKLKALCIAAVLVCTTINAQNKEVLDAFARSYKHEKEKKYAKAISDFSKVYTVKSYEMNLRLGWLYYLAGGNKESLLHYQRADELMPASTEAKWAMITVYSSKENWNEVEGLYHKILKLDAKNAGANYSLGLIYYYRKDYVQAKRYFNVALDLTPFNYNYMLMSAWTNYFLGNINNASVLFNKVLLYSPNDASALEGLSLIK
ncbi:tetratricopeptide repeat protein [Wenyingzhuangia sp. IMCC45574]